MTLARVALIAALTTLISGLAASGQDAGAPASESPSIEATPAQGDAKSELTEEDRAEKQARKACKIKICDILATKDPQGDDVSCDIVKTWRDSDITKMLGGRFDWPWGKAVCQSKLDVKREQLANAMTEGNYEVALPAQKVSCTLAQKDKGEPYEVKLTLSPKVKFKDGKATEANINWGEASAPLFVYPLIYAGTGLDNQTNVLGPQVVHMVNEFATRKCAQIKAELPHGTPN